MGAPVLRDPELRLPSLIRLVDLVCFVDLVHSVSFVPDKPDN